jgi:hypothetical protein
MDDTTDDTTLLNTGEELRAVTSWLLRQGILAQFGVAKEMAEEDRSGWRPLTTLGCRDRMDEAEESEECSLP